MGNTVNYGFFIPEADNTDYMSSNLWRTPIIAIDTRIKTEVDASIARDLAKQSVTASLQNKRIHRQDVNAGVTDANGFITIAHGAPFTPTLVQAISRAPGVSFALFWGSDNYGAANVRLRFMHAGAAGPLNALAVGDISIISWE